VVVPAAIGRRDVGVCEHSGGHCSVCASPVTATFGDVSAMQMNI